VLNLSEYVVPFRENAKTTAVITIQLPTPSQSIFGEEQALPLAEFYLQFTLSQVHMDQYLLGDLTL